MVDWGEDWGGIYILLGLKVPGTRIDGAFVGKFSGYSGNSRNWWNQGLMYLHSDVPFRV